jgi:hypothetical protein
VFAVDAATFAVSSLALALLGGFRRRAAVVESGVVADLRAGWHEVVGHTWVWTSIAYFSLSNLAVAPLFVLGPVVARESLGGPEAWGLILMGVGIGLADRRHHGARPAAPSCAHARLPGSRDLERRTHPARSSILARRDRRSRRARVRRAQLLERALAHDAARAHTEAVAVARERVRLARVETVPADRLRACGPGRSCDRHSGDADRGRALHASASVAVALSPAIRKVHRPTALQQPDLGR